MTPEPPLHLFDAFGVEIEYMTVRADSLDVLPVADEVIREVAGDFVSDVELEDIHWSNELVLHVIELKTAGPAKRLEALPAQFQDHVGRINRLLEPLGGRLMPSAMHPWMDPRHEMRLWPHEYNPVYAAYHRIFDCRGHGWANLQSVHLNLPFAGDEEFARLHAAVRLLLPVMPALAASSPAVESRLTGLLDNRMDAYRRNSRVIPSIAGRVIPEPVFTREAYERSILARMYRDIAPYDPEGILRHEWLNSRGAIPRFERNTIEIRVLDVQECPLADVAICAAVAEALEALVAQRWTDLQTQQSFPTEPLEAIFLATIREAERAVIRNREYLEQFGFPGLSGCTAQELWQHLAEALGLLAQQHTRPWQEPLRVILRHGPLARRIQDCLDRDGRSKADGSIPLAPERMAAVYRQLCDCLAAGKMFQGCE